MIVLFLLAAQEPWEFRVETEAWWSTPKFRLRDGEENLKGESVFARDLNGDEPEVGGSLALSLRWHDEIARVEFWGVDVENDGVLPQDTAWSGEIIPAGTPSDFEVRHRHWEIGYRHRFHPWRDILRIDAGLDVQYLTLSADMGWGKTQLRGFYWTPETETALRAADWLELWLRLGGFMVATVKSELAVLEPFEIGTGLRFLLGGLEFAVGWTMVHVHIEENMGDIHEDIAHLRLRSWQLGLNLSF